MADKAVRILFLADEPDKGLWDFFEKEKLNGIDLIISCGDLPPQYLSFLATYFKGDILYVPGNHDECYDKTPPAGCISIDGRVYVHEGIRIAGIGGSMKYRDGKHQYTEKEMNKRVKKLMGKIRWKKGVDIFVAHSPAAGLNDGTDLPHRGFSCFHDLLEKYKPAVFAHGHVHMSYAYNQPRVVEKDGITVINAYQKYVWDYPTTPRQSQ
ncbi:MAG TPA: metallophosphoesterase [Lachnospiraceae bacterium]|nr:metallophosphoesterase [Lachnospiraceae bacterium]